MIVNILVSEGITFAFLGGVGYQLITYIEALQMPKRKRITYGENAYILSVFIYAFLAGLVGFAYFHQTPLGQVNKVLALQTGISTPFIFRTVLMAF